MKVSVDSNIILYAEGINDTPRKARAINVLDRLPVSRGYVAVQALGEVHRNLVRKARWSNDRARASILAWQRALTSLPTSEEAFAMALDLSERHKLQIWDAVIVAVSIEAGCHLLISEDMQSGLTLSGLTIVSPFEEPMPPLLSVALSSGS